MAFPSTSNPTTSAFGTDTTTHNVSMPGTVNSGDLLITCFAPYMTSSDSITTPAGWTLLDSASHTITGINQIFAAWYAKVADGTEGGGTVNFATSVAATAAAQTYRVTDWFGSISGVEVAASAVTSGGTAPNPPSLSPSWGAEDTLWITGGGAGDDDVAWTGAPTNYSNLTSVISGGGTDNGCSVGTARRELNSSTQDPSSFTLAANEGFVVQTLAVRPAAAAGADVLPQGTHQIEQGNVGLSRAMHTIDDGYIA
ncbi:hypothetical protein HBA54_04190 [Pelagibius litoralis]|uniref:Uncharacterized protein n=1 Tax=Pelagibius litoralis TaxID=374515 RepID=A0A967C732_9PROT|nr:hypothetical protein [Pelagibius litoralis]NIA67782.1 hypothetical protein [Pelagibius litoralis]